MNWKRLRPNLRYYSGIFPEPQRKSAQTFSEEISRMQRSGNHSTRTSGSHCYICLTPWNLVLFVVYWLNRFVVWFSMCLAILICGTVHSPKISSLIWNVWSRDSTIGKVTGYGLHDRRVGVRVPVASRILSSPRRPDRFWDPPNVLSNAYQGLFLRG
jgi:hypothetical protein